MSSKCGFCGTTDGSHSAECVDTDGKGYKRKLKVVEASPLVHFNSKRNGRFECGEDKYPGAAFADKLGPVTCIPCLKAIITNNVTKHRDYNPHPYCDDCDKLNLTEAAQDVEFAEEGVRKPHFCHKFGEQIFHAGILDKRLLRTGTCKLSSGYEAPLPTVTSI